MVSRHHKSRANKPARFLLTAAAALSTGLGAKPAVAQDCYRVVDLGALGFTAQVNDAFGINATNQAVFTAEVAGKKHAMLYLPAAAYGLAAGVHDLHDLAGPAIGDESAAHDINSAGIVVGWGENGGEKHAFVWRLDIMQFIDLGTFANGDWSEAWAINDDSPDPIIVGDGENKDDCNCDPPTGNLDIVRAFWLPLTTPPNGLPSAVQLLQAPEIIVGCDQNTKARDVNTAGVQRTAAGYSFFGTPLCAVPFNCGSTQNATVWENPDPMHTTGTALPFLARDVISEGWGISDLGAIVGNGYTAANQPCLQHALYWHTDANRPVDLGSIAGAGDQSRAERINNNTPPFTTLQVVGWGLAVPTRPLLWECDTGCDFLANWDVTEINGSLISPCHFDPPDWEIHKLFDVNNNGWLIGAGSLAGVAHGVVLVPMAACAPAVCQGDIDGDGTVGVSDLLILLGSWGLCPPPPATCFADLDCDGAVGDSDLDILQANWGPCP